MGEKRKRVYHALVEGATSGLSDKALYRFVQEQCPKTSGKRLVRASLLALTDPNVMDRNVLNTIYALAIKQRVGETARAVVDDGPADAADTAPAGADVTADDIPVKPTRPRKSRAAQTGEQPAPRS